MESDQKHDGILVSIEGRHVHVVNGMQRLFTLIDTTGKAVALSTDRRRVEFTKSDCGTYLVPRLLDQQETLTMTEPDVQDFAARQLYAATAAPHDETQSVDSLSIDRSGPTWVHRARWRTTALTPKRSVTNG